MVVSSFGLAFGIGGGSYASRLMGMNKKEEANMNCNLDIRHLKKGDDHLGFLLTN